MLDEEKSAGRLEEAQFWYDSSESVRTREQSATRAAAVSRHMPEDTVFSPQPIENLFHGDQAPALEDANRVGAPIDIAGLHARTSAYASAPDPRDIRTLRDIATRREGGSLRYPAINEIADQASLALRTLRGLAHDEDPGIAREAKRVLRELGLDNPSDM